MQTQISKVVQKALSATQEHSTQESPVNIQEWAKWFGLETLQDPQLEEMVRVSARFVMELRSHKPMCGLILLGSSGAGKSHIARRIKKHWDRQAKWYERATCQMVMTGQFCYWPNFLKECRSHDHSRSEDLCEENFVVLDDIGAGTDSRDPKGWIVDTLGTILENRINPRANDTCLAPIKRATIVTANLSLEQLATAYDTRIASRLLRLGSNYLEVDVPDYATRIHQKQLEEISK